jgi:hypothetical protein
MNMQYTTYILISKYTYSVDEVVVAPPVGFDASWEQEYHQSGAAGLPFLGPRTAGGRHDLQLHAWQLLLLLLLQD